jgi:DNA mismatch repair protein MutS
MRIYLVGSEIHERLEAVEELKEDVILRSDLRDQLQGIHDLERLITRLTLSAANARDLVALKLSLFRIPELRTLLKSTRSSLITRLFQTCDELQDVAHLISHALEDEPPYAARRKLIRAGITRIGRATHYQREGKTDRHLERKERHAQN